MFFKYLTDFDPIELTIINLNYGQDASGNNQTLFRVASKNLHFYCVTHQLEKALLGNALKTRKVILSSFQLQQKGFFVKYDHTVESVIKFLC